MKLVFIEEFELEVGEESYKGTLRDLTKKERKDNEKKQKKALDLIKKSDKLVKEINSLNSRKEIKEKLNEWSECEKLLLEVDEKHNELEETNSQLENKNFNEDVFKDRLELSLGGDDKKTIMEIGEEYGYQKVFETIQKDIMEKKK